MIWSLAGAKEFSSDLYTHTGPEAHPASCPVATNGSFPRSIVQLGCEANHLPPSSTEFKGE